MVIQVLDYGDFLELAHHILRGDQVIVRGSDVTTVTSILDVLKARRGTPCTRGSLLLEAGGEAV